MVAANVRYGLTSAPMRFSRRRLLACCRLGGSRRLVVAAPGDDGRREGGGLVPLVRVDRRGEEVSEVAGQRKLARDVLRMTGEVSNGSAPCSQKTPATLAVGRAEAGVDVA